MIGADLEPVTLFAESDLMRQRVRAHLRDEIARGLYAPENSSWAVFDKDFARRFGQAGFIGITWPKEYGGQERSFLERFVIFEELLAHRAPAGAFWMAERQSGLQLMRFGAEAAKARLLPGIAKGEISFGIGASEPGAGSDLATVATRAEKTDGGWRLNGTKIWTTHGDKVDYLLVLARTGDAGQDRHQGLTQFIVDMRSDGIEVSPIRDMTGKTDFCQESFDACFVPDDMVLGSVGEGWQIVTAELAFERSGPDRFLSSFGLIEAAADIVQGGVGHEALGRMLGDVIVLREMSLGIAGLLEQGESPNLEAAMVKDLGNRFEQDVPEAVRQMLGSAAPAADAIRGKVRDMAVDATSWSIRGGTREIIRGIIAKGLGLR